VRTAVHLTYLAVCLALAVLVGASLGAETVGVEDPPLRVVGHDG